MPHQCVKCATFYPDGSEEILKGCNKCGGRFFFYVKQKHIEEAKDVTVNLSEEEKVQLEEEVMEIIGEKQDEDYPVVLDFETIRVMKPGKYELDLIELFKGKPLVYRLGEGKYVIDIISTLQSNDKNIRDGHKYAEDSDEEIESEEKGN
ncbi:hypothetical protein HYX19_02485 [Candidatus Woesearchaeota archaeon]|nr:hypothetical protein [Candidatus Woesearchaeota archaeon]